MVNRTLFSQLYDVQFVDRLYRMNMNAILYFNNMYFIYVIINNTILL